VSKLQIKLLLFVLCMQTAGQVIPSPGIPPAQASRFGNAVVVDNGSINITARNNSSISMGGFDFSFLSRLMPGSQNNAQQPPVFFSDPVFYQCLAFGACVAVGAWVLATRDALPMLFEDIKAFLRRISQRK